MTLKLILAFLFTDLSQHIRIHLMVFALKYFIDGHVGRGDARKVIYVVKLSQRTTTQI